jgi:hypothetical protein
MPEPKIAPTVVQRSNCNFGPSLEWEQDLPTLGARPSSPLGRVLIGIGNLVGIAVLAFWLWG